ncbi:MAG: MotA/TolQ/ExbB proton channel family protein [Candidatus Hydrogenedentes bacterium]|nr:MotA/TolQ/ExbB proton channel family protein [Candidatus Hydrogenedentota bacterium]MBI3119247.1 MotA/TolQ/ExbB proton channel family protein [Candidatus Hydrogenedentota bacterium]
MDFATLLGFTAGILLVIVTILLTGDITLYIDLSSVLLVMGGTLAATLINFPLADVLSTFNTLRHAFVHKAARTDVLIQRLVQFATISRREGILALENHGARAEDPFLRKSVQLAVDGTSPEAIKDILTTEVAFMEERHAMGQSVLSAMASFSPAFGMIGTLIGLVAMLSTLDNPSQIGKGMAVALLTTLYGALLAYLVFLPAVGKLKVRTALELLNREIIIEGILSIQAGDNPRVVEQKLKAFVAPGVRELVTVGR